MTEVLSPAANPILIGHDVAVREVMTAFLSGRMHHAWLITGMDGIGKMTLALHIAHFVLSKGENHPGAVEMNHPTARLVAGEAHPDLYIVRRRINEKTGVMRSEIAVDDARNVNDFMGMTAALGGWRVIIIDGAHDLNRFGQNAILKFVEEPAERTLVIITTRAAGALLPTIRSRCRVLPLSPLSPENMHKALAHSGASHHDAADVERVIELSGGSVGTAISLLDNEVLPLYDEVTAMISNLPTLDRAKANILADKLNRKGEKDKFDLTMNLLVATIGKEIRACAATRPAALEQLLQLNDAIRETLDMAERGNLDKKVAFLNVLGEIRRNSRS